MKRWILLFLWVPVAASCLAQPVAPLEESPAAVSSLGYQTVAEALESLKVKPGVNVTVTQPDGWIIVNDAAPSNAIWSFTPTTHYAYPAVVRRAIKRQPNGNVGVEMVALCQAEKQACDRLIREFQQLNEQMRENIRARLQQGNAKP